MLIDRVGSRFIIKFDYNPKILSAVRNLPERRFDYAQKCWTVPVEHEEEVRAFARSYRFQFSGEAEPEIVGEIPPMPKLKVAIPFKVTPRDYQKDGVAYCLEKRRCIMGDQPGLGKTMQAIGAMMGSGVKPWLVICPNSLKENWKREVEKFSNLRAMILTDSVKRTFPLFFESNLVDVFIVNIESLKKYFVAEINVPEGQKMTLRHIKFKDNIHLFKGVVLDESHRFKAVSAQQTKFAAAICKGKDYVLALTGTPVINNPKDLVAQLGIIQQMHRLGGYQKFVQRYCTGNGGASNLRELNYFLNLHCFYRREKNDVLKDLPEKTRQTVVMDISTRKEYLEAENSLIDYLKQYKQATDEQIQTSLRGEIMVRIGILKNISARGKIKEAIEFISDMLESGEKFILFAHLKDVIAEVKRHFPSCVSITGDDSLADRQNAVDRFQNDPKTKLIVCSIKAAGVGLTLTAASNVGFLEFPWTYADCEQCEDRAHRIGQKGAVTCYYFLGKETFDERMYEIIQEKRSIADAVTGTETVIQEGTIDLFAKMFKV